jgi:hypothetical protein
MVSKSKIVNRLNGLLNLRFLKDDVELRKQSLAKAGREQNRQRLATHFPAASGSLIDRLEQEYFDVDSLRALALAPLAVIAWASGSLSDAEQQKASIIAFESDISDNGPAIQRYLTWLQSPPPSTLLALWQEFTVATQSHLSPSDLEAKKDAMVLNAFAIAFASGGFLGFGKICPAEQAVMDCIDQTYESLV